MFLCVLLLNADGVRGERKQPATHNTQTQECIHIQAPGYERNELKALRMCQRPSFTVYLEQ